MSAVQHRATAALLQQSIEQHDRLIQMLSTSSTAEARAELSKLRGDAENMRMQVAEHLAQARAQEQAAANAPASDMASGNQGMLVGDLLGDLSLSPPAAAYSVGTPTDPTTAPVAGGPGFVAAPAACANGGEPSLTPLSYGATTAPSGGADGTIADGISQQSTQNGAEPEPPIGALLTAAGFAAAVVLPGGLTLGAAAIAAAPYLGIDPSGHARRYVTATLCRDTSGRFAVALAEDADGAIYISQLRPSDVEDERHLLRVSDRVRALNGTLLQPQVDQHAPPSPTAGPAAPAAPAAPTPAAAGLAGPGVLINLDDALPHLPSSAPAIAPASAGGSGGGVLIDLDDQSPPPASSSPATAGGSRETDLLIDLGDAPSPFLSSAPAIAPASAAGSGGGVLIDLDDQSPPPAHATTASVPPLVLIDLGGSSQNGAIVGDDAGSSRASGSSCAGGGGAGGGSAGGSIGSGGSSGGCAQTLPPGADVRSTSSRVSLDEAKALVRQSADSLHVELYRLEVKPLVERMHQTKSHLQGEMEKVASYATPRLESIKREALPRIEAAGSGLNELATDFMSGLQQHVAGVQQQFGQNMEPIARQAKALLNTAQQEEEGHAPSQHYGAGSARGHEHCGAGSARGHA